jgi:serine/threonine protein kinase
VSDTAVQRFWDRLARSELLPADRYRSARRAFGKIHDPVELSQHLIHDLGLTRWQCQELGRGRDQFFLGKYELVDKLGAGGMGTVYRARRRNVRREVSSRDMALKVVSQKALSTPGSVERFRYEVRTLAALNHPNIITALDAECEGDTHFLVMDYAPGSDLSRWFAEFRPLPVDWVCECIRQAAVGLHYAHEQGLVHRDIKPGNLLVMAEDTNSTPLVKILDLGMARFKAEGEENELTSSRQILGTPDYIAPEQARGDAELDPRSDIYSLGCTLYKLLSGLPPFPADSVREKLKLRLTADVPPLVPLRSDATAQLDAVIARMTARDPADRYPNCAAVAEALAPLCGGILDPNTVVISRSRRSSAGSGVSNRVPKMEPAKPHRASKQVLDYVRVKPWLSGGYVLGLLSGVVLLGWALTRPIVVPKPPAVVEPVVRVEEPEPVEAATVLPGEPFELAWEGFPLGDEYPMVLPPLEGRYQLSLVFQSGTPVGRGRVFLDGRELWTGRTHGPDGLTQNESIDLGMHSFRGESRTLTLDVRREDSSEPFAFVVRGLPIAE